MNNTVTDNSDLKGCFWNPRYEQFTCVISEKASGNVYSDCKKSCPKVCSKNHWKCNKECIPVSQPCNGSCMPVFSYECDGSC